MDSYTAAVQELLDDIGPCFWPVIAEYSRNCENWPFVDPTDLDAIREGRATVTGEEAAELSDVMGWMRSDVEVVITRFLVAVDALREMPAEGTPV